MWQEVFFLRGVTAMLESWFFTALLTVRPLEMVTY